MNIYHFRVAFKLGRHERFVLRCLVTKLEMLHIRSFVLHKISRVDESTADETDNRKDFLRNNVFLMISTGGPIQDGRPTGPITIEKITPQYRLAMF